MWAVVREWWSIVLHLVESVQLVEPVGDGLAIRPHGQLQRIVYELLVIAIRLL